MSFVETVERARRLLERNGRLSLRALEREFALDDAALQELGDELVDVQRVTSREGPVLVWVAAGAAQGPPPPGEEATEGLAAERRC